MCGTGTRTVPTKLKPEHMNDISVTAKMFWDSQISYRGQLDHPALFKLRKEAADNVEVNAWRTEPRELAEVEKEMFRERAWRQLSNNKAHTPQ